MLPDENTQDYADEVDALNHVEQFLRATPEVESYTPTWTSGGCTAKASQLLANGWGFRLWDSDVSSNDTITAILNGQITETQLIGGKVVYGASGGMKSLTVQLQKQP